MDKLKFSQKLKKCFEIKTKKDIFVLCVFIVLLLLTITCLIEQDQIVKEITVLRYENKYKQTQKDEDLINLVIILQNSKRDNAKIRYSKALINSITEEGVHNSVLKGTAYEDALDSATPREIAIDLYLYTILSVPKYDLYVSEFADLYPKLSYEMQMSVDAIAPDNYSRTKDIKVLKAGVKANKNLSESTDDELLRRQCEVNAKSLETVIAEIESSSS